MRIRIAALTAVAALSLGAAACTQAEQDDAQADANEAAAEGRPGAVDPTTDRRVPAPAN